MKTNHSCARHNLLVLQTWEFWIGLFFFGCQFPWFMVFSEIQIIFSHPSRKSNAHKNWKLNNPWRSNNKKTCLNVKWQATQINEGGEWAGVGCRSVWLWHRIHSVHNINFTDMSALCILHKRTIDDTAKPANQFLNWFVRHVWSRSIWQASIDGRWNITFYVTASNCVCVCNSRSPCMFNVHHMLLHVMPDAQTHNVVLEFAFVDEWWQKPNNKNSRRKPLPCPSSLLSNVRVQSSPTT